MRQRTQGFTFTLKQDKKIGEPEPLPSKQVNTIRILGSLTCFSS